VLLRFDDDALEFFENWELFVGRVDFGVAVFGRSKEACLFETAKLALDVARVFFD